MPKTRLVMVDDQTLFADSLRSVISSRAGDIEVIGVAYDGTAGLKMIRETQPDLVLMDVRMPGIDGVNVTRIVMSELPSTKIVMLTTFDDDEYVTSAIKQGALGYLLKSMEIGDLLDALRHVARGGMDFAPTVVEKIVGRQIGVQRHESSTSSCLQNPAWYDNLTIREKQILSLVTKGLSNSQIAEVLFMAEQTVKNHVSVIYDKMNVPDRVHAVIRARDAALDFSDIQTSG